MYVLIYLGSNTNSTVYRKYKKVISKDDKVKHRYLPLKNYLRLRIYFFTDSVAQMLVTTQQI